MSTIPVNCVNEVISCSKNVLVPKVGMMGTYFVGSDRYAVVVGKVFTKRKIGIVTLYNESDYLDTKTVDGIEYWNNDAALKYGTDLLHDYDPKRFLKESIYTLRKNGRWVEEGKGMWNCGAVHLGKADAYTDPYF